jgi:uncharacterized phage-associated protein
MNYQADAVANEFLVDRLGTISPMKLQKLVYYAHAWSLALYDKPLVSERLEAWEFGPVWPSLYHEFKRFGNSPIMRLAVEIDEDLNEINPRVRDDDETAKGLITKVWDLFGDLSAVQLSNMSHAENEPWVQVPKKRPGLAIPDELTKRCFKSMLLEPA